MDKIREIVEKILSMKDMDEEERIAVFNMLSAALGNMVSDILPDPVCSVQLCDVRRVVANDYNPNTVASPELDLLENSMRVDGITMPVVVVRDDDSDEYIIVDGFHRRTVADLRLNRRYIPCSVIDSDMSSRMASTIRHNRARGKHQVELMASLVKTMLGLGVEDGDIADSLGMSKEELLRLRQMVGAARVMAAEEYSLSWGNVESEEEGSRRS